MEEKVRQILTQFNETASLPFELELVSPSDIRLLKKNARYMDQSTFRQLVENIKADNQLTSMPLCVREDGVLTVISGNHRVQAALVAEVETILVMVLKKQLTRQELVARQLSHNSLCGEDDMILLRSLWAELEDVEWQAYSGLDSNVIGELESIEVLSVPEMRYDYETIQFSFLPEEKDRLLEVINEVSELFSCDENFIVSLKHYETAFEFIADIKEQYNIVNTAVAFSKILELAHERLVELKKNVK